MEPTTPPRRRREAPPPKSKKRTLLWAGGSLLLLLGAAALYRFGWSDRATHNELPVSFPAHAPRGDVVPVKYGVKAGDLFETHILSDTHFVLVAEEKTDVKQGMAFTVKLTVTHEVTASPNGGAGLLSRQQVFFDSAVSHVDSLKDDLRGFLDQPKYRYAVTFDRDAAGRPIRSSILATTAWPGQRFALDGVLSGLGDLPANGLPPRDVRLGETWDLAETMSVPGIEDLVRLFAQRDTKRNGYPAANQRGLVQATALETRGGEECLKLHVLLSFTVEGDVGSPAKEGYISTAARIDGFYWVSLATGLVWEEDLTSDMLTSYLVPNYPTERKATAHITATTKRVDTLRK